MNLKRNLFLIFSLMIFQEKAGEFKEIKKNLWESVCSNIKEHYKKVALTTALAYIGYKAYKSIDNYLIQKADQYSLEMFNNDFNQNINNRVMQNFPLKKDAIVQTRLETIDQGNEVFDLKNVSTQTEINIQDVGIQTEIDNAIEIQPSILDTNFISVQPITQKVKINLAQIQGFIDEISVVLNKKNYQKVLENYKNWNEIKQYYLEQLYIAKSQASQSDKQIYEIILNKLNEISKSLDLLYLESPWVHGRQVLKEILNNNYIINSETHLNDIINLIWHFYEISVNKEEKFYAGTFKIQDNEGKILNFLTSYSKTYNRSGRLSSHFGEVLHPKYGLDIPQELRKLYSFTNEKHHLLFGKADVEGYIFIKPEPFGIEAFSAMVATPYEFITNIREANFRDSVNHCVEFGISKFNKTFLPGSDDEENMRKERVPHKILEAWKHLVAVYENDERHSPEFSNNCEQKSSILRSSSAPDLTKENSLIQEAKIHGIKFMVKNLNGHVLFKKPDTTNRIEAKNKFVETLKGLDNSEIRKGREVIIQLG